MTVPVHSTQFYVGAASGSTAVAIYTVPAGYRAVLKAVNVQNSNATSCFFSLKVDAAANIIAVTIPAQSGVAGLYQWNGWVPLNEGQQLKVTTTAGKAVGLAVGGYLYPLSL